MGDTAETEGTWKKREKERERKRGGEGHRS